MRAWPTGAVAIREVLRAIQCICQPASHGSTLLSSAYTQSIPLLQYHSTSDGLDILSLFLFLLVFLMQASKESILRRVFFFKREHDIYWNFFDDQYCLFKCTFLYHIVVNAGTAKL